MSNINDLNNVTIENPRVGDVLKYTADGWKNAAPTTETMTSSTTNACGDDPSLPDCPTWEGGRNPNPSPNPDPSPGGPIKLEDVGCPAIEVTDSSGKSAEVCANKFELYSSIRNTEGTFETRSSDNELQLSAVNSQLWFKDANNTTPVPLSTLVGTTVAPNDVKVFDPIIRNFSVDEGLSNPNAKTRTWGFIDIDGTGDGEAKSERYVRWTYPSDWATLGLPNKRDKKVVLGNQIEVVMPDEANAAIIFYQGKSTMGPGGDDFNPGATRALHISHRLTVEGATFPITSGSGPKDSFGNLEKAIIITKENSQTFVEDYQHTKSFNKMDVITFAKGATLSIQAMIDVLRGGRGGFNATLGRVVMLPFYAYSLNFGELTAGFSGDDSTFNYSSENEDELDRIYDTFSPPATPASDAEIDGAEIRTLLARVINALGSRKITPPAGGATEAEFDAQIAACWALTEDQTLETVDELQAAVNVLLTEVTKEKYGISFLFEFESQAGMGATQRGLL